MLNLGEKFVGQIMFVIGYAKESEIRTKQFDIEKALSPLIKATSKNTNVPDEFDPHVPRVTLNYDKLAVMFSQVTAQLSINFEKEDTLSFQEIQSKVEEQVTLFQSCVNEIIPSEQQKERGIIVTIRYKVDINQVSPEDVSKYIHSNFFSIPPLGTPASGNFNVGYKTDDNFFITLGISDYRILSRVISKIPNKEEFDKREHNVEEAGIELKVDINSRPLQAMAAENNNITGVILKKTFDFITSNVDKFMGIK